METSAGQADALLLILDEAEFLDIGAIVGLRARPSKPDDQQLIDAFIDSDATLGRAQRKVIVAFVPDLLPH